MKFSIYCLSLIVVLILNSCSSQVPFGEIIHKKEADSLKSIQYLSNIKNLNVSDFKKYTTQIDGKEIHYRLLKPQDHSKKKYPLVVVFHGSGAIGNDNEKQMGLLSRLWLLPKNQKKYPAYIFSPQFSERSANYRFDKELNVPVSFSNENLTAVLNQIDKLKSTENIDPKRIYIVGFSMGAATVMNAISERPDLFAAAVNVSGISRFDKMEEIKSIPIWIVHGKLDTDNKIESNLKFYDEFSKRGKIAFWIFDDKYHNNIMGEDLVKSLPNWLFKQRKK